MNKTVNCAQAPAAIGPYSHAFLAGDTLYTSGQIGVDAQTNELLPTVDAQARMALINLGNILKEGGMGFENVVKTTVFLVDMADFGQINTIYNEFFKSDFPARSCVQVAALPKGALFEIEAIAVK